MAIDYKGESVQYNPRSNTYSRPPVKVYRICKHGFKRVMLIEDPGCPCYKCIQETNQETLKRGERLDGNGRNQNNEV